MDYRQSLGYILSFTDYERLPGYLYRADNFDLRRMSSLLDMLGSPHLLPRSIQVAGTKGNGSTAAMIASALTASGGRTGLYTSPHLHTFRERIAIDGRPISEEQFAALASRVRPAVERVNRQRGYGELTTFEILTALAFLFFAAQEADFQVLEVGLGGRLDATNVAQPELCVITSISLDHAEVLGDSVGLIAGEKAGIIKPGAVVVSAPQPAEAEVVIAEACRRQDASLVLVGRDVTWEALESGLTGQAFEVSGRLGAYRLSIPLLGRHQLENAATATAALEVLGIGPDHIARALAGVRWPGRLEVLRTAPLLLVDGAHNADSARRLRQTIEESITYRRLILVIGASADKDIAGMLGELAPIADIAIATRSRHPRALEPHLLLAELENRGIAAEAAGSVSAAIERALELAAPTDLVCASGSLFVAAEAIEHVRGVPAEVL